MGVSRIYLMLYLMTVMALAGCDILHPKVNPLDRKGVSFDTTPPRTPKLNPVVTPTNRTPQTISGYKDAGAGIWVNGKVAVAVDDKEEWSYPVDLVDGKNAVTIFSKDKAGNTSGSITVIIVLDRKPPEIARVSLSGISSTSATIVWTTDEESTSVVEYGKGEGYEMSAGDEVGVTEHKVVLRNLSPATVYSYRVVSVDTGGNLSSSGGYTFLTEDGLPPKAPVIKEVVTPTNVLNQTLSGTKDQYTSVWVNGVEVVGLSSETVWSHELTLVDGENLVTVFCQDREDKKSEPVEVTIVLDRVPPRISGLDIVDIAASGATVVWNTDEPATSQIEYGLGASYDFTTALDGTLVASHSVTLSGLEGSKTYHYRAVSADGAGNVARSEDRALSIAPRSISFYRSAYEGTRVRASIILTDSNKAGSADATLTSRAETERVPLWETEVGSGLFEGSVGFEEASSGSNGKIAAADGEVVTVSYSGMSDSATWYSYGDGVSSIELVSVSVSPAPVAAGGNITVRLGLKSLQPIFTVRAHLKSFSGAQELIIDSGPSFSYNSQSGLWESDGSHAIGSEKGSWYVAYIGVMDVNGAIPDSRTRFNEKFYVLSGSSYVHYFTTGDGEVFANVGVPVVAFEVK